MKGITNELIAEQEIKLERYMELEGITEDEFAK